MVHQGKHHMRDLSSRELSASLLTVIERTIACLVLIAIVMYTYVSVTYILHLGWDDASLLYEVVHRVLLVSIGLELARMLVTHSFLAVLELLGFIIARKLLVPEVTMLDIFIGVVAFFALVACYRYLIFPIRAELRAENLYITTTRLWKEEERGGV